MRREKGSRAGKALRSMANVCVTCVLCVAVVCMPACVFGQDSAAVSDTTGSAAGSAVVSNSAAAGDTAGSVVVSATSVSGTSEEASGTQTAILMSRTSDSSTTAAFTWRDTSQRQEGIQYTTRKDYGANGFANALSADAACKDISLDESGVWHYEAEITGLSAATDYVYRVGCEGSWSEAHSFKTEDTGASSVTFAYMGDVQPSGDTEEEYALWGELAKSVYEKNPELAFAVLGGDIVNSGISIDQFDIFAKNATSVFSSVPLFSTVGNHESNFIGGKPELFMDYFAFPQNGPEGFKEEFYSFDCANCHVLVVNSWIFSGEQDLTDEDYQRVNDWIAADLAQSTADWQIVVTHVPVYQVHSDTTSSKVKENWAPIFEEYGVDLVFEGHQHVYSRSRPLYQDKTDYLNGITYIMGVSGSKFYDSADETFAERTVYNVSNCQIVRADGNTLTVQTVDTDGNELDYASINQRGVSVTRAEYLNTLWRAEGSPAPTGKSPFSDTTDQAVIWAYEKGFVIGYGGGIFGPDNQITAQQIKIIAGRMEAAS